MKTKRITSALIFLTILSFFMIDCHHNRVRLDNSPTPVDTTGKETKVLNHKFWVGGFFPRKKVVDATDMCPAGIYEIHEYYTWKDAVWGQATLGIYVPRTMKITCN